MASKAYENQKRTLNYSKKRIDKAGRDIRHGCDGDSRNESIQIIQNFREVHLYPLMLIKNHIIKASKKVSKKAIVARRLKRLATIIDKLERPTLDGKADNSIKLTRMQDIGGCRAIVSNIDQLKKLQGILSESRSIHKIVKTDDYLTPKDSGYGGIHLVYSCFEDSKEDNDWKKAKIEVQLRTELQHAWATSLEIIDILEGVNLKTSLGGHEKWRRFFKVAGQLVAHKEKACIIDGREVEALTKELIQLTAELQVIKKLFQYQLTIDLTTNNERAPKSLRTHQGMFLVVVRKSDIKRSEEKIELNVNVTAFDQKLTDLALSTLAESEADPDAMIAVLVAASDVRSLKKAYPNYLGSTGQFSNFLNSYINANKTKVKSPVEKSTATKPKRNRSK